MHIYRVNKQSSTLASIVLQTHKLAALKCFNHVYMEPLAFLYICYAVYFVS